VAALFALSPFAQADESLPDQVEFNRHIRPILSDKCFLCHGPDRNTREAGLRLDLRAEATSERDGHHAIVAGDATASAMIQRIITDDPDDKMPPADSNRHVSPRELELLKRWIAQGAEYEPHWSYIKPEASPAPAVEGAAWVRNPIDTHILANLEKSDLKPAPEASRETLVRRLYFDLLGLPPTPAEANAFLLDNSPNAYESLVERLLASPHFGERLAIYWLDLVRYADTVGYHGDQVRGVAPYRDYVIQAFNDNMPFDQFTREQLAGDLLPEPTEAQRIATGYNRLNMVTREGGAQEQDYVVRYAADRTRTTASVWLGSSLGCAQCHDHKFDPFTIQDFYRFGAFFADIKEMGVQNEGGNEGPFPPYLLFPNDQQKPEHDAVTKRIADLKAMLETPPATEAPAEVVALASTDGAPSEAPAAPTREELEKQLSEATKQKFSLEQTIFSSAITETMEPRTTRVLPRGNWMDETGEVVGPGVPEFLGGLWQNGARPTRLDLANWLTDRENPLTARVFANRLWKLYFGTGISRVLDDLGSQGEWPKHPELLDYLAIEFMDSGWDIKHLTRLMVTSSTYRQSSMANATLKELDPANRLLARQSRFRLEAELVRDNALKVSGLLSTVMGGPAAKPYQPAGYYKELNFPTREYEPSTGQDLYRRGVYTHWQRTYLHPSLLAFDAPTREECTAERTISNSPQQALTLMNDPIFVEAARVFAERIIAEGGDSIADRVRWAWNEALSRKPLPEEAQILSNLYEKHLAQFASDPASAASFIEVGEKPAPEGMDPVQLAAWSSVSRTILNTHEMIYRY
jgi:hypothetical protein